MNNIFKLNYILVDKKLISERIIDAVNYLVSSGEVKSVNELCVKINYSRSNYRLIEIGERQAPLTFIFDLIIQFELNPDWVIFGALPIKRGGDHPKHLIVCDETQRENENLKALVKSLQQTISVQNELITLLKSK